jgi:Fic family protein
MPHLHRPPKLTPERFDRVFRRLGEPEVQRYIAEANKEYLHWEKLRHHPPPARMTPEDGWHAIWFSRHGTRRPLPLMDAKGKPFSYWLPDPAIEILHEVDRGGGGTLAVAEGVAGTLGSMRDRVLISSLMEEAIATSQIEGAATTHKVAKEMLRTNRKPRDRSEQMIVNSYRTIQLLRERLDEPMTMALLLDVQQSMTRDTLDDPTGAGRFRTPAEQIEVVDRRDGEMVYTPPPANELPERISRLIAFANAPPGGDLFIHPLVKATILHFWLAFEHPFIDGNGRTARALLYWFMLKSGYWLFEFLTISRIIVDAPMQYHRSFLYSEHDDNDLTYSIVFQLRVTQRALAVLRTYIAKKQEEQQAVITALRRFPELNHRQRDLLNHALKHPSHVYTFQSHKNSHNITLVTARSDLRDLVSQGLLVETKQGRQRAFLVTANLAEQLGTGKTKPQRRKRKIR